MHKMGVMQRFRVLIVAIVSFVVVLGSTNVYADQSGSGYSVSANIPAIQSNKNISYFDLQLQPKQKKTVTIHLTNNGQEKAVYLVNVNNAATNSNGVIDYNQTDFE